MALLFASAVMFEHGSVAFAQLPLVRLRPPTLPLPASPVSVPPSDLSLGPPELPTIPSRPQVYPSNAPTASISTETPLTTATLDARLLIISTDGTEPVLGAIRQAAECAGIPYRLYVAKLTPGGFTPGMLFDGGAHAYYQGIVLTNGTLVYPSGTAWISAFNASEWQTLWNYQAKFRVRTVIAYAYPTPNLGYGPATGMDTSTSPISASLTPAGQSVFPYLNAANPIVITKAWAYLAPASGVGTNVLLADSRGNALALVRTFPDGREVLSLTFDGNFFLVHSLALMHGLLNWVTGGLLLGERRVYMTPQVDDVFIENEVYGGGTYRITAADWAAVRAWQEQKELESQTSDLRLSMAFNGAGTTGIYPFDTLTPAVDTTDFQFPWISHTHTHENLDAASYDVVYQEIIRNNQTAAVMGFAAYDPRALITPDVSGLLNPEAMRAAYDAGVRFLVTDTSQPGMSNPTPQAGIYNAYEPGILMIPRRPVNLFYNVTTPSQWTNEYNSVYRGHWGRDLSYDEVLSRESDVLLQYLLRGEIDPWMFHQTNLRAYDGVRTLLGDLLDRVLQKYRRIFVLPVRSLTLADLGEWTASRMRYRSAGVRASIVPAQGTIRITASEWAVVPVTGLCTGSSDVYGGQCISRVSVFPGQTAEFRMRPASSSSPVGVNDPPVGPPDRLAIQDVGPNPFTGSTTIALAVPRRGQIRLAVYDVSGRVVRTLVDRVLEAGVLPISWNGRTDAGTQVATGVYFARLECGGLSSTRRIVLIH